MLADGQYVGDGSWPLRIYVTDVQEQRELRVRSELHVGGVLLRLAEALGMAADWSDHALWWPERRKWLANTRLTLDQYGVAADDKLHFTPAHKPLRVQLPDTRILALHLDFSASVFRVVASACKQLCLPHPEELSLRRPPDAPDDTPASLLCAPISASQAPKTDLNGNAAAMANVDLAAALDLPNSGSKNPRPPRSMAERARLNAGWLDSSRSLMEQGIREFDTLQLKFKFYNFYDLGPRGNPVRLNQLYEQARWQVLNEEIDCTDEEALLFAALQLQVALGTEEETGETETGSEDDIDAALDELETSLAGGESVANVPADITRVPELSGWLRVGRARRWAVRGPRQRWCALRDLQLRVFRSPTDSAPERVLDLRGCAPAPSAAGRLALRLALPSPSGLVELDLRCPDPDSYARWLAAFRLAADGRSLADAAYQAEVAQLKGLLRLQEPANGTSGDGGPAGVAAEAIAVEDLLPARAAKRLRGRARSRLVEAAANVRGLTPSAARLAFIRAWQALPGFGLSLFVVRFSDQRREELLGVTASRLLRLDAATGELRRAWRLDALKAWNVNWEAKHMMVQFEDGNVIFECLSADCKVVHEYIGGYIFLSMRSKKANQSLNEDLFHKLTGGWE